MKRFCLSCVAIAVGFLIVVVSALSVGKGQVVGEAGAVEETADSEAIGQIAEEEDDGGEPVEEVDYYLPYPGILPDHPLYSLKMLRDRVRLWLAGEDRVELELLYADKRIGAAGALVEGGKSELGVETAMKAVGYLEAVVSSEEVVGGGEFSDTVLLAARKHFQVLSRIGGRVEGGLKDEVERLKNQVESFVDELGRDSVVGAGDGGGDGEVERDASGGGVEVEPGVMEVRL